MMDNSSSREGRCTERSVCRQRRRRQRRTRSTECTASTRERFLTIFSGKIDLHRYINEPTYANFIKAVTQVEEWFRHYTEIAPTWKEKKVISDILSYFKTPELRTLFDQMFYANPEKLYKSIFHIFDFRDNMLEKFLKESADDIPASDIGNIITAMKGPNGFRVLYNAIFIFINQSLNYKIKNKMGGSLLIVYKKCIKKYAKELNINRHSIDGCSVPLLSYIDEDGVEYALHWHDPETDTWHHS